MHNPHGTRKTHLAAAGLLCLAFAVPVQLKIDSLMKPLREKAIMPTQLPVAAAASAALGGFKGVAVDILWIQADTMINERQFYELRMIYEFISQLQPNFPSAWTYNAWNLAFNISAEWSQPEDKWLWIKEGIKFAKEGLRYNPGSEDLNFYVGFLYFQKVGKDPYFTKKLSEEEQLEPFLEAHKYFQKVVDLALERGDVDVRTATTSNMALFFHGQFVLKQTGNVPAAMEYFNKAEEGTRKVIAQFPDDAATANLLGRIIQEKARLTKQN